MEGILTLVAAVGLFIAMCFAFNSLSVIVEWIGSVLIWFITMLFRAIVVMFVALIVIYSIVALIVYFAPGVWDAILSLFA